MENELDIILRCQQGQAEACGMMYEVYVKKIYDFLYFRTFHKETAEDLTSDTFVKVLRTIQQYDPSKAAFSTWIYTIARNTLIDSIRAKKTTEDLDAHSSLGKKDNLEDSLDSEKSLQEVRAILDQFPEEQRDIMVMRLWDDLSYKEIALIIGKSEDACKMTFSRSMKLLREQLPALSTLLFFILAKRL